VFPVLHSLSFQHCINYSDYADVDYDLRIGRCVEGRSCEPPKGIMGGKRLTTSVKPADHVLRFESALTLRQSVCLLHFCKKKKDYCFYFIGRQAYIRNRNLIRRTGRATISKQFSKHIQFRLYTTDLSDAQISEGIHYFQSKIKADAEGRSDIRNILVGKPEGTRFRGGGEGG
jgi:hypothetical protein